jgi:hypothetical protein
VDATCLADAEAIRADASEGRDDASVEPRDASARADAAPRADASPVIPAGAKRLFVTSLAYPGDLRTAGQGSTGLSGADALCQNHAQAASMGGTWRAWLSDSFVNAITRITGEGPWALLDGRIAFTNRAELQTVPRIPIQVDERGVVLNRLVWTGTQVGGVGDGNTCFNWTSSSGEAKGTIGYLGGSIFPRDWTKGRVDDCISERHLYCFEQ